MKITSLNNLIKNGKTLQGKWSLSRKYEVQFKERGRKRQIALKGVIVDVKPGALVFRHMSKSTDKITSVRIFELNGIWKADRNNHITFLVKKQSGPNDTLKFKSAWTVNKNNEIIYTFKSVPAHSKDRVEKTLVFKGFWDILERNRLTYSFGHKFQSLFHFRATFQTKSILAKKDEIRYQIGIRTEKRLTVQTIKLFGKWKYSHKYGLVFDIQYRNGKRHAIKFGTVYKPVRGKGIKVSLNSPKGKDIGIEVLLTKEFPKKRRQLFLRLLKNEDKLLFEAGMKGIW